MEIGMLAKVDQAIEEFYPRSMEMAEKLLGIFPPGKKRQVKNLENLIYSTTRFTEVKNFVKNQMGKDEKGKDWRCPVGGTGKMGDLILGELERIEGKAKELAQGCPDEIFEVKMRLLRGWVRQVVAHYDYKTPE